MFIDDFPSLNLQEWASVKCKVAVQALKLFEQIFLIFQEQLQGDKNRLRFHIRFARHNGFGVLS